MWHPNLYCDGLFKLVSRGVECINVLQKITILWLTEWMTQGIWPTEHPLYLVAVHLFTICMCHQPIIMIPLTFRLLMCTFGRAASSFELFQCVLLVEVKVPTLKVQFVSAHCGNAENTFRHLWTNIFLKYFVNQTLGPY